MMSRDEETKLTKELIDADEQRAKVIRGTLISANLRLVPAVIATYDYSSPHLSPEDLHHEGVLGFCHAMKKYDPTRGPFGSYAWHSIRFYISRAIEKAARHAAFETFEEESTEATETLSPYDAPDLDAIIDSLSATERDMIAARADGETFAQIGERYGITAQSAHERFQRIRAKFRRAIDG